MDKLNSEIIINNPEKIFLVCLHGFKAGMFGEKVTAIRKYAIKNNYNFIRFEYRGHGEDSSNFLKYNLENWLQDSINIINNNVTNKALIIGSSMGGWLMLQVALNIPEKIHALVGIAAAPDFTKYLIWDKLDDKTKSKFIHEKILNMNSEKAEEEYKISYDFIRSGEKLCLLNQKKIFINCPVRLIHSLNDPIVPYNYAFKLAKKITSNDINIIYVKDGLHNLNRPQDIKIILKAIKDVL